MQAIVGPLLVFKNPIFHVQNFKLALVPFGLAAVPYDFLRSLRPVGLPLKKLRLRPALLLPGRYQRHMLVSLSTVQHVETWLATKLA